jgi:mannose-6-phosphate isomerase-like protein (cupin superfamily)
MAAIYSRASVAAESHIPAGAGSAHWFAGNLMTLKAPSDAGWTFLEGQLHAGHAPPLHLHRHEDEAFYLLEGSMRFRCGDDEFDAHAGDFIFVPRGTPHAFRVGSNGARTIQVATADGLARFIEAAGEPAERPELPPTDAVDMDRISAIAEQHDMVVVGPPLA